MGNPQSDILFIGEGPGENEDLEGLPFVGRSGQLLDKMLAAIDLDRNKNIYIANIVKCRPPKNRDPLLEEQEACIDWLRNQVMIMRPKIIVCLGRIAAMKLIKPDMKITKEHGIFFEKNGVLMMADVYKRQVLNTFQDVSITRWDAAILEQEIETARVLQEEFEKTAKKELREKKSQERKMKAEERRAKMKHEFEQLKEKKHNK